MFLLYHNKYIYCKQMEKRLNIEQLLDYGVDILNKSDCNYGQGTSNEQEDILFIISSVLNLPFEYCMNNVDIEVTTEQLVEIRDLIIIRSDKKIPVSYLVNKSIFGGIEFYIDNRAIIPRSPFAELIRSKFSPWLIKNSPKNILELCTGSGCIAITTCLKFPEAKIDAVDIDLNALEVAKINIQKHNVSKRVKLVHSNLFQNIRGNKYDLIISNPPYVSQSEHDSLPKEFFHEPNIAFTSKMNGLEHTYNIIEQASDHLNNNGALIIEVGNKRTVLEDKFPRLPFTWIDLKNGGEGIFVLYKEDLKYI